MMKKEYIFIFLHLITSTIFAQINQSLKLSNNKINEDNSPSTIVQSNPELYPYLDNGFVIIWDDYRNGIKSNFAQKFDSLGNKIGNNIELFASEIYPLTNGNLLEVKNISEEDNTTGGTLITKTAKILLADGTESSEFEFGSIRTPWCGTGYLGYRCYVLPFQNSFISFFNDQGALIKTRYSNEGAKIWTEDLGWVDEWYSAPYMAMASLPSNSYMYTYVKEVLFDTLGIYANFYSEKDSLIISDVLIDTTSDYIYTSDEYFSVFATTINDSTYSIFIFNSLKAEIKKIDVLSNGTVTKIDYLNIPFSEDEENRILKNFSIINQTEYVLQLALILDLPNGEGKRHKYIFIDYDGDGKYLGVTQQYQESNIGVFGKNIFVTNSNHVIQPLWYERDVYYSDAFDSTSTTDKLNDDLIGSNEKVTRLVPAGDSKFFIQHNNETSSSAAVVNSENEIVNRYNLKDYENLLFFSNQTKVKYWGRNYQTCCESSLGYTIYNILGDTLVDMRIPQNYFAIPKAFINNMDELVFGYYDDVTEKNILLKINSNGEILKERILEFSERKYLNNLFNNTDGTFWIDFGKSLQKYSVDFEPISSIIDSIDVDAYLGNDLFAYYDILGYYAKEIRLIKPLKDNKHITFLSGVDLRSTKLFNLENDSFITIEENSDKLNVNCYKKNDYSNYYSASFDFGTSSNKINPMFSISGNKAIIVWQDNRNKGLGYDIYGSIFDLDKITDVNDLSTDGLPTEITLAQNYPNPFNPTTTINYTIPVGDANFVFPTTLIVYDVLGNEIKTLVNEQQLPGKYSVKFDGSNLASGVYFYKLQVGAFSATKKLILLK